MPSFIIPAFAAEFTRYRSYADKAVAKLTLPQMRVSMDTQTNSIAIVMKHLGGNLQSRWSDIWTTDGEKPWRDRDAEFVDDFESKDQVLAVWARGFDVLGATLATLRDEDLPRELRIRHEPHTLALALARSLSHVAYHTGQIVQVARVVASRDGVSWETITVPRGGSVALNQMMADRLASKSSEEQAI